MDAMDLDRKLYYTISEVSELCGVKPHVLRYWEGEFPTLRPRKGRGGSRRYRRRDIEEVLAIKSLLHEQGYRIAGARKHLAQRTAAPAGSAPAAASQLAIPFAQLARPAQIEQVRRELTDVLALVRKLGSGRESSAEG
jgi:DNA-binding transcriptional MerR regulator